MNVEECVKKGLLKKTTVEKEKILGELNQAEHYLGRAKGNFNIDYFDITYLLSYNSMFHSARALLFKHGFIERSHGCLIIFLKNKCKNTKLIKYIELLDSHRRTRHMIQYAGLKCNKEEAGEALKDAEKFFDLTEDEIYKKEGV